MTVQEAIAAADAVLPGTPAPDGEIDVRWQAVIRVAEFLQSEPEAIWPFVVHWGASADPDLRMAISTCLLEHLLEQHYDRFIERVEALAAASPLFADAVSHCWIDVKTSHDARPERLKRLRRASRPDPS